MTSKENEYMQYYNSSQHLIVDLTEKVQKLENQQNAITEVFENMSTTRFKFDFDNIESSVLPWKMTLAVRNMENMLAKMYKEM